MRAQVIVRHGDRLLVGYLTGLVLIHLLLEAEHVCLELLEFHKADYRVNGVPIDYGKLGRRLRKIQVERFNLLLCELFLELRLNNIFHDLYVSLEDARVLELVLFLCIEFRVVRLHELHLRLLEVRFLEVFRELLENVTSD